MKYAAEKTRILLLGPKLDAVSGVSMHLNQLLDSTLVDDFDLRHFEVGSEGQQETTIRRAFRTVLSPFRLAARIIQEHTDIVHINASLDNKSFPRDAAYTAVARVLGRKVVFQVHGGQLERYATNFARERFVARVLRSAHVVVLLARTEVMAYSKLVPDVQIQLIPNGVQLEPQADPPGQMAHGPIRLTYIGRLVPDKGVSDCIAAAILLGNEGRIFKLTIAGEGPEEISLKNQARELILESRVEFVGVVRGDEKNRLWQQSDVFVSPTHHEGLPYSLLESMASGTVPITTRVGAQPDVMEDGVHGIFVPISNPQALYDAVARLDDDRQLLMSMSQEAVQRIRDRYSIERLSSEFRKLYQSLMESRVQTPSDVRGPR